MQRIAFTVFALATLTACADHSAVTAPVASASRAAAAPPPAPGGANRGALVERSTERFTYIVTSDPEQGLTTSLGARLPDIAEECAGRIGDYDPFSWWTVTTPNGKLHNHVQGEDVMVLVWAGYYDFDTDFCAFVARTPLLAVGTADYVVTTNISAPLGAPGATEINLRAHGTVTNVRTGQRLHYVVRSGSLQTGGGSDKGFNNNIQLTPLRR